MKVERGQNEIKWSHMFMSYSIPITAKSEFIYGPKSKRIFIKNIVNHQLQITVYDLRGKEVDKRTYGYKFHHFFEEDGFVYMLYYDFNEGRYFTGRFMDSAGITGITPADPPT